MKKITYLFTFLISIMGFSQNLVTNGNFQTGTAAPWTGNAANVVDFPLPPLGPLWLYRQASAYLQKPLPLDQLWQGNFDVSTSPREFPHFLASPLMQQPCADKLSTQFIIRR